MIHFLEGTVERVGLDSVVLEVGGMGFYLLVPSTLSASLTVGSKVRIATHLVVRPEQFLLFGFSSNQERELFNMLNSIKGIGPKLALNILSAVTPGQLAGAILDENYKELTGIKGIGKRTARRIVVELQEKIAELASDQRLPDTESSATDLEAVNVLLSLGCTQEEAETAVAQAIENLGPETASDRLVMEAMRVLA